MLDILVDILDYYWSKSSRMICSLYAFVYRPSQHTDERLLRKEIYKACTTTQWNYLLEHHYKLHSNNLKLHVADVNTKWIISYIICKCVESDYRAIGRIKDLETL